MTLKMPLTMFEREIERTVVLALFVPLIVLKGTLF
jgi:hypothetical protein